MKTKFLFITFLLLWGNLHATVKFISPNVKDVSFSVEAGKVFTTKTLFPKTIVQNQLKYLFGVLNEIDSGIDFPNLTIEILATRNNGGFLEIDYTAKGSFAWNGPREIPSSLRLILPKRGDDEGLTDFLNKYQKNCAKKTSLVTSFWNYYRPNHEGCPLKASIPEDVVLLSAVLKEIDSGDDKREPNYRQIFDDNILEITAIMTKENLDNPEDISIWDFNTLCDYFSKDAFLFNKANNECHSEGKRDGQIVKAHVFLIENFNDKPDIFFQKIRQYVLNSDLVTYNGHSGLGLNIESWMKFYPISKEKYQIVFLNSCDTYGYFRDEFFNRIKSLNQVQSSGEHIDVILNATPNYFGTFSDSNVNLVKKLLKSSGYSELLKSLPVEQHSLLLYEQ